jgi:hypothetical protein
MFAEQLGQHAIRLSSFRQTMPVTAVSARDPILGPKRFANPNRDRFLTDGEMRHAWKERADVQRVHTLLE